MNREGRRAVRPRAAVGAVLLVLIAHAFVASATHFHSSFTPSAGSAQATLLSGGDGAQNAPSSGDPRCFLCRLQRDFVSSIRHAAPALAPPAPASVEHEPPRDAAVRAARLLIRSGRAPPHA